MDGYFQIYSSGHGEIIFDKKLLERNAGYAHVAAGSCFFSQ